jgi:hypothetical protein
MLAPALSIRLALLSAHRVDVRAHRETFDQVLAVRDFELPTRTGHQDSNSGAADSHLVSDLLVRETGARVPNDVALARCERSDTPLVAGEADEDHVVPGAGGERLDEFPVLETQARRTRASPLAPIDELVVCVEKFREGTAKTLQVAHTGYIGPERLRVRLAAFCRTASHII